jgi:hypothetical protein
MRKSFTLFLLLFAGLPFAFSQSGNLKPSVSKPVYFDVSPPLRDMAPAYIESGKAWTDGVVKNEFDEEEPQYRFRQPKNAIRHDIGLQDYFGTMTTDTTLQNFDGVGNIGGSVPPDTYGEVGPNQYFQVVNTSYAIFNKTGGAVFGPFPNNSVWTGMPYNANSGDAVVHYDENANRWIFSQFSLPNYPAGPFFQMIAISKTPDPTGQWYRYQYLFPYMNDYPKFGIWPDGYYMSANYFGNGFMGNAVCAFDRTAMLAGDSSAQMITFTLPPSGGMITLLPSDCDGTFPPMGTPNYFGYVKMYGSQYFGIYEFHADFANPSASTFGNLLSLPVTAFNTLQSGVPQQGTSTKLDGISDRLMYRLQFRNFNGYWSMVANHTVGANLGRAAVRWYEFRKTSGPWSIYQQSTYAPPDSNSRWMASIAMDTAGTIALGYSLSGPSMHPAIAYTARKKTDPLNQMTYNERRIINGGGSQTGIWSGRSRWGDYSTMSIDPSNPTTFWYSTEYYPSTASSSWMTRIGAFSYDNSFSTMASATPSRVCLGDSSQLQAFAYGGTGTYTYQWTSIPAGFTSTLKNPKVTPTDTTRYVVATTNGSVTRHDTVRVAVIFAVTAAAGNDTTVCSWLHALGLHGMVTNYKLAGWGTTGDGKFGNIYDMNTNYTFGEKDKANGSVDLKLIAFAISPCTGSVLSTRHVTIDACTGIPPSISVKTDLILEPNPAQHEVKAIISGLAGDEGELTLTGADGKVCSFFRIEPSSLPVSRTIDVSALPRGIYIVHLKTETGLVTKKLVLN